MRINLEFGLEFGVCCVNDEFKVFLGVLFIGEGYFFWDFYFFIDFKGVCFGNFFCRIDYLKLEFLWEYRCFCGK